MPRMNLHKKLVKHMCFVDVCYYDMCEFLNGSQVTISLPTNLIQYCTSALPKITIHSTQN